LITHCAIITRYKNKENNNYRNLKLNEYPKMATVKSSVKILDIIRMFWDFSEAS